MMGIGMAVRPPRSRGPVLMMISALRRIGGSLWMVDNAFTGAYIDITGTQPVTAYADLLGLGTDRLGVLGPNLFTGTYALGASTTATYSGWEATATFGGALLASANNWLSIPGNTALGTFSVIEYWATYVSGGSLEVGSTWQVGDTITAASNGGVRKRYTTEVRTGYAGIGWGPASFGATSAGSVWKVEVISVRELTGSHATQSAVASKPSVQRVPKRTRGPVNNLLWSGDFTNAAWTSGKSAGATVGALTTGPDGQQSARLVTFAGAVDFLYQASTSYTTAVGQVVTFAMVCSTATQAFGFGGSTPAGTNTYVAHDLTGGWWLQVLTRTFTAATTGTLQLLPSNGYGLSAGVTVAYHRAALFQGPVTAQQIIDNGGIPLTTTTALPNVLEWATVISFDGSNDFLQTGITTGNEGWVCAGVAFGISGVGHHLFGNGGASATDTGVWLRVPPTNNAATLLISNGTTREIASAVAPTFTGVPKVIDGGWDATTMFAAVDGVETVIAKTVNCTTSKTCQIGGSNTTGWYSNEAMYAQAYTPVLPDAATRKIIRDGIAALQGRTL